MMYDEKVHDVTWQCVLMDSNFQLDTVLLPGIDDDGVSFGYHRSRHLHHYFINIKRRHDFIPLINQQKIIF